MDPIRRLEADMKAHLQIRPQPPGGWVSHLNPPQYQAYMKKLEAWCAEKERLITTLEVARRGAASKIVIGGAFPDPENEPRAQRPILPVDLQELEAQQREHDRLVDDYTPGDRKAYILIRNLRASLSKRYGRLGEPRLFSPLPSAPRGRAATHRRAS